jgi:hypothetical protein
MKTKTKPTIETETLTFIELESIFQALNIDYSSWMNTNDWVEPGDFAEAGQMITMFNDMDDDKTSEDKKLAKFFRTFPEDTIVHITPYR